MGEVDLNGVNLWNHQIISRESLDLSYYQKVKEILIHYWKENLKIKDLVHQRLEQEIDVMVN